MAAIDPVDIDGPGGSAAVIGCPSVQRKPSDASSGNAAG